MSNDPVAADNQAGLCGEPTYQSGARVLVVDTGTNPVSSVANGEKITLPELTKASGQALASLEEQSYRVKRQKLERLIQDRLLAQEAQRRKLPLQAYRDGNHIQSARGVGRRNPQRLRTE